MAPGLTAVAAGGGGGGGGGEVRLGVTTLTITGTDNLHTRDSHQSILHIWEMKWNE